MDTTRVTRRARTALALATGTVLTAVVVHIPASATATVPAHHSAAAAPIAPHSSHSLRAFDATSHDTTAYDTTSYDDTYYKDALGKTGPALKESLHRIISTTQTGKLTYDAVWDALKDTDQDPANSANVILLYSGRSASKNANGGGPDDWNREHVWAKSHGDFGTDTGPGTDLHHLRPANVAVNSARGDKDFDKGGAEVPEAPGNYTDDDSFEPRDAVKGDVARMILYMAVRYDGGDGFPDLEPNDKVGNGTEPHIGKLSVLKQWSKQDPPDAFEKHRNQVIFDKYQHNRNPFIDHPEWVDEIW
ncbi:endonuclease I family protein [Streptomyces auratus]|uniref:Secreted ribonuclease n=1 Tax=Streptomyces auratus AGR0001 TaxID=1160718 RepID=J2A4B9_9ACTN|nr:endonuclease [Streptomyces auratus]